MTADRIDETWTRANCGVHAFSALFRHISIRLWLQRQYACVNIITCMITLYCIPHLLLEDNFLVLEGLLRSEHALFKASGEVFHIRIQLSPLFLMKNVYKSNLKQNEIRNPCLEITIYNVQSVESCRIWTDLILT